MAESETPPAEEPEQEEPSGEEAFFARLDERVGAHIKGAFDEGGAFDQWIARQDALLTDEEKKSGSTKGKSDASTDGDTGDAGDGRSEAQRLRESGRVGPGRPSSWWDSHGERWLYGRKARG